MILNCKTCPSRNFLFKHLTNEELDLLISGRLLLNYNAGELIYKQGTDIRNVICLNHGLVKMYFQYNNNKKIIYRFIRPLNLINNFGMFTDEIQQCSASAVEDSSFCFLDFNTFRFISKSNALFCNSLLNYMSKISIFQFYRHYSLSIKHSPGLIAEALLYFSDTIYESSSFHLSISHQDIADYCSITTENLSRILKDFKETGLININGKNIDILKPEALKNISEKG